MVTRRVSFAVTGARNTTRALTAWSWIQGSCASSPPGRAGSVPAPEETHHAHRRQLLVVPADLQRSSIAVQAIQVVVLCAEVDAIADHHRRRVDLATDQELHTTLPDLRSSPSTHLSLLAAITRSSVTATEAKNCCCRRFALKVHSILPFFQSIPSTSLVIVPTECIPPTTVPVEPTWPSSGTLRISLPVLVSLTCRLLSQFATKMQPTTISGVALTGLPSTRKARFLLPSFIREVSELVARRCPPRGSSGQGTSRQASPSRTTGHDAPGQAVRWPQRRRTARGSRCRTG